MKGQKARPTSSSASKRPRKHAAETVGDGGTATPTAQAGSLHHKLQLLDEKVDLILAGMALAIGPGFEELLNQNCHAQATPKYQPEQEPSPLKMRSAHAEYTTLPPQCLVFDMSEGDEELLAQYKVECFDLKGDFCVLPRDAWARIHDRFATPVDATVGAVPFGVVASIDRSPARLYGAIAGAIRESNLDPGICDCSYELNHKGKLEVTLLVKHTPSIMGDKERWYQLMKERVRHEFGISSGSLDYFVRWGGPGCITFSLDEFAANGADCGIPE